MPFPRPDETVRLMFEARNAGDLGRVRALMHPDVAAHPILDTEVHAHRIEADGEDVVAYGRIRFIEDGALADSPAAWRFRVAEGLVLSIAPERT